MKSKVTDVVDFHAHILPLADHGSSSVETSLFQLRSAMQYGVSRIIATPHFYPNGHHIDSFLECRSKAFSELSMHLTPDLPEVRLGAEVLICRGIENMPDIDKLFIKGTETLLLELPFSDFDSYYARSTQKLISRGVSVVLAHADRYPSAVIDPLVDCGAKIQLNATSLARLFNERRLYDWLKDGHVVAIGSDIHGEDKCAYKSFVRAIDKIGEYAEYVKSESDKIWDEAEPSILNK